MAKYQLTNLLKLALTLFKKNEEGKALFRKEVMFRHGRTSPSFEGGIYNTNDKQEIECLDAHPWNQANGGRKFFRVDKPSIATPTDKKDIEDNPAPPSPENGSPAPSTDPEKKEGETTEEGDKSPESENGSKSELDVQAEITTVQEASQYLRSKDTSLKVTDVRTKAQIAEVSAKLGISFPNL